MVNIPARQREHGVHLLHPSGLRDALGFGVFTPTTTPAPQRHRGGEHKNVAELFAVEHPLHRKRGES